MERSLWINAPAAVVWEGITNIRNIEPHEVDTAWTYRIGVPRGGDYRELINSDQEVYGGAGVGNGPVCTARAEPCHGMEHTLSLVLPPLATLFLKPC